MKMKWKINNICLKRNHTSAKRISMSYLACILSSFYSHTNHKLSYVPSTCCICSGDKVTCCPACQYPFHIFLVESPGTKTYLFQRVVSVLHYHWCRKYTPMHAHQEKNSKTQEDIHSILKQNLGAAPDQSEWSTACSINEVWVASQNY